MRILTFAVALLVASPLACGEDEEQTAADKLENECNEFCQAFTTCQVEGINPSQCSTACSHIEEQLGGACVEEYTATLECTNAGGYMCTEGGPIPNDLCLEQNQALITCTGNQPSMFCQRFCEAADDAGCAPGGSVAACATSCNDTRAALGMVCSTDYDIYLSCASLSGDLTCSDGEPVSPECQEDLLGIGNCLTLVESPCRGYCFNAGVLGCQDAAACENSCNTARDAIATCTESYDSWLECVAGEDTATCNGAELDHTSCDFDRQQYDMCIAGG